MHERSKYGVIVDQVRSSIDHHGITPTLFSLAYRGTNKLTTALVLKGITLSPDHVAPEFLEGVDERDERWRFLSRDELEQFGAALPELCLDRDFIAEAIDRGDRCYGFVVDGTLATYGWYSTRPTPMEPRLLPGLMGQFNSSYVYFYKAFTAPAYRGMHLHGIGMARAMKVYVEAGSSAIISYVEAINHAALKSCKRIGCRDFGTVLILKVGSRYLTHATSGCRHYGIQLNTTVEFPF